MQCRRKFGRILFWGVLWSSLCFTYESGMAERDQLSDDLLSDLDKILAGGDLRDLSAIEAVLSIKFNLDGNSLEKKLPQGTLESINLLEKSNKYNKINFQYRIYFQRPADFPKSIISDRIVDFWIYDLTKIGCVSVRDLEKRINNLSATFSPIPNPASGNVEFPDRYLAFDYRGAQKSNIKIYLTLKQESKSEDIQNMCVKKLNLAQFIR